MSPKLDDGVEAKTPVESIISGRYEVLEWHKQLKAVAFIMKALIGPSG